MKERIKELSDYRIYISKPLQTISQNIINDLKALNLEPLKDPYKTGYFILENRRYIWFGIITNKNNLKEFNGIINGFEQFRPYYLEEVPLVEEIREILFKKVDSGYALHWTGGVNLDYKIAPGISLGRIIKHFVSYKYSENTIK